MRQWAYATASLIALGASLGLSPAEAQTAAPSAQSGQGAGQASTLQEIVVTAQRRQEKIQDVPIAITAFSTERLKQQNITNGQDLNGQVPSLVVGAVGEGSRDVQAYTLRGQGATYEGASSVVVYLSDVPLPQAFSTNAQGGPGNYLDLENVQVLAGPQGTLFGRNTTGGAVLLVPHKPTNEFGGYIEASGGNYGYNGVEGVVNIPIVSDKLLLRAAATYQDRDGYTHDLVWDKRRDDRHYFSGRVTLDFKPNDKFENNLLYYGTWSSTNGSSYINQELIIPTMISTGQCVAPCAAYQYQNQLNKLLGPRQTLSGVDEFEKLRTWGIINTTSYALNDEFTVKNIVSYQKYWNNYANDEDGTPFQIADYAYRYPNFPVPSLDMFGIAPNGYFNSVPTGPKDDLKQVTEEIQLQGHFLDKHLTFTSGFFYYDQKPDGPQLQRQISQCAADATGTCTPLKLPYSVTTQSKALYTQATLDLGVLSQSLENVRLTGGYRYTWDTINGNSAFFIPFTGFNYCVSTGQIAVDASGCAIGARLKSSAPTWTFGVDYKPMSSLLLYAKVSRGYKAGGYNPFSVRPSTRTFAPEHVTSYEGGFKSDWHLGDMPARFNLTGYISDYSNIQRAMVDAVQGLVGAQILPAKAKIRGFEAEGTIRPIEGLELGANASYTDAHYNQFSFTAQLPTEGCSGLVPTGGTVDATCNPFGVPKWIYSIHGSLDLPAPEAWGSMSLYANYSYISKQVTSPTEPGGVFPGYGLLNMSFNWRNIAHKNVDMELFATNLTNKLYVISNSNISAGGFYSQIYGEPRMYGVRVRYRFGE